MPHDYSPELFVVVNVLFITCRSYDMPFGTHKTIVINSSH